MRHGAVARRWRQLSRKLKARWRRIFPDDGARTNVARDSHDLAAKIEEKYGIARESVANEVKEVKKRV